MRAALARPLIASSAWMASDAHKPIFTAEARGQAAQFTRGSLHRRDLHPMSPIAQFHAWFAQAQAEAASEASSALDTPPETCTLATASLPSGRVSARVVYLKELDAGGGFVVYSNWASSRKAADLASNPHAALVFHWPRLQRQVRVEGVAAGRVSAGRSQAYFDTRARGSRLGAWASRQSEVLEPAPHGEDDGRAQLDAWVAAAERRFGDGAEIPVPDFWGGMCIVPERVEFWQGRDSRLHDRFVYERLAAADAENPDGRWKLSRLSP